MEIEEKEENQGLDPIFQKLIGSLSENRESLEEMLETVSEARKQIKILFPDKVDFKNKRFYMEERMKTISGIFSIELDIRKQKEQSIKAEIELRRKLAGEDDKRSLEDLYQDSVALAKALEIIDKQTRGDDKKLVTFDGAEEALDMAPAHVIKGDRYGGSD